MQPHYRNFQKVLERFETRAGMDESLLQQIISDHGNCRLSTAQFLFGKRLAEVHKRLCEVLSPESLASFANELSNHYFKMIHEVHGKLIHNPESVIDHVENRETIDSARDEWQEVIGRFYERLTELTTYGRQFLHDEACRIIGPILGRAVDVGSDVYDCELTVSQYMLEEWRGRIKPKGASVPSHGQGAAAQL